jgi:hypothetical protein
MRHRLSAESGAEGEHTAMPPIGPLARVARVRNINLEIKTTKIKTTMATLRQMKRASYQP